MYTLCIYDIFSEEEADKLTFLRGDGQYLHLKVYPSNKPFMGQTVTIQCLAKVNKTHLNISYGGRPPHNSIEWYYPFDVRSVQERRGESRVTIMNKVEKWEEDADFEIYS